jgi:hypothetical protein
MSSVFHYTDINGLLGILSSGTLFATDYRYLNDATEGSSIRGHMMRIFEAEIGRIMPDLISKKFLKKEYYEELGTRGNPLEAERLYGAFIRAINNVSPFFVLSFCRHEKDTQEYRHGLLSQWRGYADSGGVAIEFDESGLDSLAHLEQEKFAYVGFKSDNVEYKDFKKVFNPNDYTGIAGEMIWQVFNSREIDVSIVTGRKNIDEAVIKFAQTAPFLKHWGFHEEVEYRIVMTWLRPNKIIEEEKRPPKEIKFRQKSGLLIPYIGLFESLNRPLPVKSIIVGPHPLQQRQREAVTMFVESKKLKITVRSSKIPYRR